MLLHSQYGKSEYQLSNKAVLRPLRPSDASVQDKVHEAIISLSRQKVESNFRLGPSLHAPGDGPEIALMEKIALEDEGVRLEIAKLNLPSGSVIVTDPWIYGLSLWNDNLIT